MNETIETMKKMIDAGKLNLDATEFAMQVVFSQIALCLGGNSAQINLVSERVQALIDSIRQINSNKSSE